MYDNNFSYGRNNRITTGRSKSLLEKFNKESANEIDWISMCVFEPLSESFIEEFQDNVDWEKIYQSTYIYRFY